MNEAYNGINVANFFAAILLPFLTNLSIYIFVFAIADWKASLSYPPNVCVIFAALFKYIGGLSCFYFYGRSSGGWEAIFGSSINAVISIMLAFTYPMYYLMWLPFLLYKISVDIGTPVHYWQKAFENGSMSLENISGDSSLESSRKCAAYFYIGIPFSLFALLYICLLIIFSPIVYYFFSPIGLGNLGIILNIAVQWPSTTGPGVPDRIKVTTPWGNFSHIVTIVVPLIIVVSVYLGTWATDWPGILAI